MFVQPKAERFWLVELETAIVGATEPLKRVHRMAHGGTRLRRDVAFIVDGVCIRQRAVNIENCQLYVPAISISREP